jgi:hypothetical protein
VVHRFGAVLDDGPQLMPIDLLRDLARTVADEPRDVLNRHVVVGEQRSAELCLLRRTRTAWSEDQRRKLEDIARRAEAETATPVRRV